MVKFGGNGKSKQACIKRNCANIDEVKIESGDEEEIVKSSSQKFERKKLLKDESSDEDCEEVFNKENQNFKQRTIKDCFVSLQRISVSNKNQSKAFFPKESIGKFNGKLIFDTAEIRGKVYEVGDFVKVQGITSQIVYFYTKKNVSKAHLKVFIPASESILDETADPKEILDREECSNIQLRSIEDKVKVKFWHFSPDFHQIGGTEKALDHPDLQPDELYYRFAYAADIGRFSHAKELKKSLDFEQNLCPTCLKNETENSSNKIKLFDPIEDSESEEIFKYWKGFTFRKGEKYRLQDAVLIRRSGDKIKENMDHDEEKDPKIYTEYYRKQNRTVKGSNKGTNPPFDIGIIEKIMSDKSGTKKRVEIRCLFRPEQTKMGHKKALSKDLNLVYWTEVFKRVDIDLIEGIFL